MSCDRNIEKFHGKVGSHLNWDQLSSKKMSPTKVAGFAQTNQLANKVRTITDNQKI
jgi:hypothetical protein